MVGVHIDQAETAVRNESLVEPGDIAIYADGAKANNLGAGIAWRDWDKDAAGQWNSKAMPLGKYLAVVDAEMYAICMAVRQTNTAMDQSRHITAGQCKAQVFTDSKAALEAIAEICLVLREIETRGDHVELCWLPGHEDIAGSNEADAAAKRAARQPPRDMRSASLAYAWQWVKEKWQRRLGMSKHIGHGKKLVVARCLQLRSGHAVTGKHLLRTKQVDSARCWWCVSNSKQTVAHLMLHCRKWRRERDTMLRELRRTKVEVTARRDTCDVRRVFGAGGIEAVLAFIETTAVGKRREVEDTKRSDEWQMAMLDRGEVEGEEGVE
ncbi:hypothetical protein K431DRAFT_316895 [Polychaeton citri CBS 116435]|uniref:RNase H type-1 domain-containing protein n=1 Tax=Polychaeton citri CBS 116435 TaxID=1314669 RepID=A0A9P4UHN1_9PEZI|nr:hypothetical protein K431DRAFT_316895 [Polychaeton citri CBS 116435]